jgi:hypothetical protein
MGIVMMYCILAVCPALPVIAAEPAENEAGTSAVTPATMAAEMDAMRDQINLLQKEVNNLRSILTQKQQTPGGTSAALNPVSSDTPASGSDAQSDFQQMDELELVKGELQAVAESAAQANQRLTKIETDTLAYTKSNDAKVKQLGVFAFSGDIRGRFEPFFQEGAPNRNRERIRLRFNMSGKISDEFSAGFSLATGSSGIHEPEFYRFFES